MFSKKIISPKNIVFVIIGVIFLFFLQKYLAIPPSQSWNSVESYLNENGKIGQQIVFCPSYLLNYAKESHLGKFNNFDARKKPNEFVSLYDTYFLLGTCEIKNYLEKVYFPKGIKLYKMRFDNYQETNPFLVTLYKTGKVRVVKNGEIKNCDFVENYFKCGENEWERVGLINTVAGGKKIDCILTHPKNDSLLILEYKNLTPGKLIFGFSDFMANDEKNTENIIFQINNQKSVALNRNNRYQELDFDGGELLLSVVTTNDYKKQVCFNLINR